MKRLALVAVLLLSLPALAYPKPVGRLVSAGAAVNNNTTAVPFSMPTGSRGWGLQCDAAVWAQVGVGTAFQVTATTGVYLPQWAWFDPVIPLAVGTISILPISGSANCTVFQEISG